jgi:hypothetical protein
VTGLVGWWPLHESSGKARDLSGNGNHGTLNGGVTQGVAGKAGLTSYSLNGSDQYVAPNSNVGLSTNSDFTFSTWVKFDSGADNRDRVIGLYDGSDDIFFFGIEDSSENYPDKLHVRLGHLGGNEIDNTGVGPKIRDDNWHHIVICWNSVNEELRVYIDNNLEYSESSTVDDPFDDSETFNIGNRSDNSQYLAGQLVDVRIYDRALSPQEIKTLYDWGNGDYTDRSYHDGSDPGAISRWKFDGGVGDSWGSNDGTDKTSAGFSSDAIRGQSKNFDGSDDYIDTTINSLQAPFSFFAWIKTNSASNRQAILSNYNASNDDFQFEVYDTGEVRTWGDQLPSVIKGGSISGKEWYHTGVVISSNGPKLFVNGKQVESDQSGNVGEISQNTNFYIGSKPNDTGDLPFDGGIDDARIYNGALEPHEVFQIYQWGTRGRDMRKLTVNQR